MIPRLCYNMFIMELKAGTAGKIQAVVKSLFGVDTEINLSVPDEQFGDFATNVAMQLAGKLGQSPKVIAAKIVGELAKGDMTADVAGPGFINITVSDGDWLGLPVQITKLGQEYGKNDLYKDKVVVAEYSDLNAFKTAHAGHLYTTLVGDSISRIFEAAGATVHRTNFGGDVGLHVGRAMWAIMKAIDSNPAKLADIAPAERAAWVSARYIEGTTAHESDDEAVKAEVVACNKLAYDVHAQNDHDSVFARVYWTCREWSYEGFEDLYHKLDLFKPEGDLHFRYYPESETAPYGVKIVHQGLEKDIFEESDGAVVYKGEKDGLHTRVFLTSAGLPTYEAKDLGLAVRKWEDYHFDMSFMVTANDIQEYMKVVLAALKHFYPEIAERTKHLTHGLIKLEGGVKMSSRKGNVVLPEEVLESARLANYEVSGKDQPDTVLAAVKYAFLKQRIGGDIIYDSNESVSTTGNSGPYLQYAHARARSILGKSTLLPAPNVGDLTSGEKSLLRKLSHYTETVQAAAQECMPHHICTYLYELCQVFNRFYESSRVVGDEREVFRLSLVGAYSIVLKNGLSLLGIQAPDSM
jgi:arginyl-tRNA synthetase